MRKYFLFTAVALLMATNVNAATGGTADLKAEVTLIPTTSVECTAMDFGKLYLRKTTSTHDGPARFVLGEDGKVTLGQYTEIYEIVNQSDSKAGKCTSNGQDIRIINQSSVREATIPLQGNAIYVDSMRLSDTGVLTGELVIKYGTEITNQLDLEGATTIIFTYE